MSIDSLNQKINFSTQKKNEQFPKDSLHYFSKVLKQPDKVEVTDTAAINPNRIMLVNTDQTRSLYFPFKVIVIYNKAGEDQAFLRTVQRMNKLKYQKSIINLTTVQPVSFWPDGNYFPPQSLYLTGYWSWQNKICNRLPLDYKLPADANK